MALSSSLNPNVVKTALDSVFFQEYESAPGPMVADATDPFLFQQETADSSAIITEIFKGTGLWDSRTEEEDVASQNPRVGNQQTFSIVNYANSLDIPKNFFDDDKHTVVQRAIRDFAEKARITMNDNAFSAYRNAFTTLLSNDGVALFSNSHTNLTGDTIDNLETAALSEASLNTLLLSLMQQKDQSGVIRGHQAQCLLVSPADFKEACEIVESELRSGTANNDMNVYSSKYGLYVKQSPYLGAAAGGSDTAWFLLAKNHSMYRWVRQAMVTAMVDYIYQRNNVYIYKGEFREKIGAMSYEGMVGSTGAA